MHDHGYYSKTAIEDWRKKNIPEFVKGEDFSVYLANATTKFKSAHQYMRPDDLSYFRCGLGGHSTVPKTARSAIVKTLGPTFNEHVYGEEAGTGWHTESQHANGTGNWSYKTKTWLQEAKGTYWVNGLVIKGVKKTKNDGETTFFPSNLSIDTIRADAEYVANNSDVVSGLIRTGTGRTTGIRIDCLMKGNTVISAYPHRD